MTNIAPGKAGCRATCTSLGNHLFFAGSRDHCVTEFAL
jgi:hypothetical protein